MLTHLNGGAHILKRNFDSIKNKSLVEQVAHQVCYFKNV